MRWWPDSSRERQRGRRYSASVWAGRLYRPALWAAIVAGPVLGTAALVSAGGPPPAPPATVTAPAEVVSSATRLVAVFVAADDPADLAGLVAESALRDVDLPGRDPVAVQPAATRRDGDGWFVTVAVSFDDGTAAWYAVALQPTHGSGWVVVGLPARVADPAGLQALGEPMPPPSPGDERLATVEAWLRAYLTGDGDVERFSAPSVSIAALSPPPYTSLEVTGFQVDGRVERPVVSVEVRAANGDAVEPLTYRFELAGRDGRWEIAAMFPSSPAVEIPTPSTQGEPRS